MSVWDMHHAGQRLRLPTSTGVHGPRRDAANLPKSTRPRSASVRTLKSASVQNLLGQAASMSQRQLGGGQRETSLRDKSVASRNKIRDRLTKALLLSKSTGALVAAGANRMKEQEDLADGAMMSEAIVPISRIRGEADEMNQLATALREAALTRMGSALTLDSLAEDFERDFRQGNIMRGQASSMLVKASNVVARLQSALGKLEASSAVCLSIAQLGATERESAIRSMIEAAALRDDDFDRAAEDMERARAEAASARALTLRQTDADVAAVAGDLASVEAKLDKAKHALAVKTKEMAALMHNTLEAQRERQVKHLQQMAVHRLKHHELARGWTTWLDVHRANVEMMRRAIGRFRNSALWSAFRGWCQAYPPMTRVRRAMEPLKEQIRELERGLRKEKAKHATTKASLEARLNDTEASRGRAREAERQNRVQHMLQIAVRRLGKQELARGWSKWVHGHQQTAQNRMRAAARFRNVGLYSALCQCGRRSHSRTGAPPHGPRRCAPCTAAPRTAHPRRAGRTARVPRARARRRWKAAFPPRPPSDPEELAEALKALEWERRLRKELEERLERTEEEWQAKWDTDVEARQTMAAQSAFLSSVILELQQVLDDALAAPSWAACRKLLYHESLRYVDTAATHGRGGYWPRGAREAEIATRLARGETVGRLVDGEQLAKVARWSASLRAIDAGPSTLYS